MQLLRKILFALFFSLYVVLCPLLILYALGYIFTPHGKESLTRTGLIRLVSYPSKAKIFINGKNTGEITPATFSSLRQGSYRVRVEKQDYLTWQADVQINPSHAEVIDPLILVPKEKQFKKISDASFDSIIPILKTDYLLLFRGNKIKDTAVYSLSKETIKPLAVKDFTYDGAEIMHIFNQQKDTQVVFKLKHKGKNRFVILDLTKEGTAFKDITSLFIDPDKTENVFWQPENRRHLFVRRGDIIDKIDLDAEAVTPEWVDGILGFGMGENEVFVLKKNLLITKKVSDEEKPEAYPVPLQFQAAFDARQHYKIEKLEKDIFLFIGDQGDFIVSRPPYQMIDEDIHGFEIEKKHKQVLLWTKHQIGIMQFEEDSSKDSPFEPGPAIHWLFTKASRIEKAFFAHDGSHVLFQDKDRVYLARSELYAGEKANEFFRVWEGTHFYYAEQKGSFYFLDRRNSYLISWKLIPDEVLLQFMRTSEQEKEGKTA